MKEFGRVIDRRIVDTVGVSTKQANCSTTDAIRAARLLLEKHQRKRRPLHIAFLDLETAFERVPHEVVCGEMVERSGPQAHYLRHHGSILSRKEFLA
ncbi:unnamed protein product [Nippostrongylus brasiliensis]|uniref:Reverse transcriptase domain-containing protein n=1 Tax=Nippostrongylus brasiliensis TaxID=27835 RepID=A0A0N4XCX6_NIPBR|nr:unnamed protein product [Nippostrongylus brasiliensis]